MSSDDGRRMHVLIEFVDIPDHGRNAGWICSPYGYKDGDPIGHGQTMREAFGCMLDYHDRRGGNRMDSQKDHPMTDPDPNEPHIFEPCKNKHLDMNWPEPHCAICLRDEDHAIHNVVAVEAGP